MKTLASAVAFAGIVTCTPETFAPFADSATPSSQPVPPGESVVIADGSVPLASRIVPPPPPPAPQTVMAADPAETAGLPVTPSGSVNVARYQYVPALVTSTHLRGLAPLAPAAQLAATQGPFDVEPR